MVHLIFDDSRARLSPEKGGLGYTGVWTTFEGLRKMVRDYQANQHHGKEGVQVSSGSGLANAERGVQKVLDELNSEKSAVEEELERRLNAATRILN